MESALHDLLTTPPPALSEAEVHHTLFELYHLSGTLSPLPGERDQNFHLRTDQGQFVLKFHNLEEDPQVVEAQDQALQHLARVAPTLSVPRVVPPQIPASQGRIVRLLTWVEGTQVQQFMPLNDGLLTGLGQTLAQLDQALSGFSHLGSAQVLLWDIQRVAQLRPLLGYLPDTDIAELCAAVLDHMEADVLPAMAALPLQAIHNDANPFNVLADGCHITGLLDFGDMILAPRIQELAVATAYHLGDDPLRNMLLLSRAYHQISALNLTERGLLPAMVAARCVATVTIGSWRHRLMSGNGDYILKNYSTAAKNLRYLWPNLNDFRQALCSPLEF